jgi:hypothetical protein
LQIHKEKEMVSFRRCILALAVLALFASLGSAQIVTGPLGTSSAGNFACAANVANPTAARSEGYAELLGDIVITCTGGNATAATQGSAVPTANITIALNNTIVTSRVFSNGLSEALLLIDEPGAQGGSTGPGTALAQTLCASSQGTGPGGCQPTGVVSTGTFANVTAGSSAASFCTTLSGATCSAFGTTPNVFQGVVSGNQVIFNGIPILAPVTGGLARTFRITNIRGNAAQFAGQAGQFQGQIPILASITISSVVTLTNPVQTTAFLFNGLGTTAVRNATNTGSGSSALSLLQCNTAGITGGSVLRFPEGFANAFKTRVAATSTYSGIGAGTSGSAAPTIAQNVPGAIYNGSESGFVFAASGGTAGLADFGTRLKATFNNIPTSVQLYVSTTNLPNGTNVPAATNTGNLVNLLASPPSFTNNGTLANNLLAGLVVSETAGVSTLGSFLPLQSGTNNVSGVNLFGPLPVDANGTATAVWEILTSNPNAFETAEFAIFYAYTGNPQTNTPPTTPAGTVSLSFAPTYSSPTASSLVPRFTPAATSTSVISFVLCQTTLLFPFVSSEPGFDTGIAIANTSSDPFGTRTQAGTCTMNFYGSGAGTTPTATTPTINFGTVYADQLSNLRSGFRGYIIAVCNFQLAHGYALFSDTGIRNWATGYLPLILPSGTSSRNGQNVSYNPNTAGVEGGVH